MGSINRVLLLKLVIKSQKYQSIKKIMPSIFEQTLISLQWKCIYRPKNPDSYSKIIWNWTNNKKNYEI